jgi:tRNA dimethylallyltransferase
MADRKSQNKIIFLVGPTASGKTETAAHLAKRLKAEIVSCDSMQVYKKMDIITSKPSKRLLEKIPHHLIGVIPAAKEYNVSRYREDALNKAKDIISRNKIPLFVGGTGLYMTALIDGIFNIKAEDKSLRIRLYRQAGKSGSPYLHKELKKVDPAAAEKIHPNDARRIIRALEVFKVAGKPISILQKVRHGLWGEYDVKIFCLNIPRNRLYDRIDKRVEKMFKEGLIKEVRRLLNMRLSRTASAAIGLKELKGYFEGSHGLDEAKNLIKRNTRQYAKRQLTWFRKDKRIKWVNIKDKETPRLVAERIWGNN